MKVPKLKEMTLREKIEQLNQIMYLVDDFDKLKERIKKECIGSVILATGCLAGCTQQETMFVDTDNFLVVLERYVLADSIPTFEELIIK